MAKGTFTSTDGQSVVRVDSCVGLMLVAETDDHTMVHFDGPTTSLVQIGAHVMHALLHHDLLDDACLLLREMLATQPALEPVEFRTQGPARPNSCPSCEGAGIVSTGKCASCGGSGRMTS